MINFLKKYWLNILWIVIFLSLVFFFIPNEEGHYFQPDIDKVKSKSHIALLWTEAILGASLFIWGLTKLKKITEIFFLLLGISTIALVFFFVFDSIFLSSTFFLNRLTSGKAVDKKYTVVYIGKDGNNLMLHDNATQKNFLVDRLPAMDDRLNINVSDTIIVSFKKGFLGFNFNPVLKSN